MTYAVYQDVLGVHVMTRQVVCQQLGLTGRHQTVEFALVFLETWTLIVWGLSAFKKISPESFELGAETLQHHQA